MLVSIGILAHNEASDIGNIIRDLGNQALLSNKNLSIEIHVVANGCTDATVDVSKEAFSARPFQGGKITTFVHTLLQAGKSNAWNELVHKFTSGNTEFVFIMDADIRIPENTTLQLMLDRLTQSKTACVAVDKSVKDLSLKDHNTVIEKLILAASGTASDTRTAIAGGLYCAHFKALKDIWMPIGLPGEDGFLRAMLLTSNFTQDENRDRHIFVQGARHIFKFERHLRDVFRHNIRLAIGTGINVLLFKHFRENLGKNTDIPNYIRRRNAEDPNWINELIANKMQQGNYFIIDPRFILRRLEWYSSFSFSEQILKAPIFISGVLFDLGLFFAANHL